MVACIKCHIPKEEKQFGFADKAQRYRKRICKKCTSQLSAAANKEAYTPEKGRKMRVKQDTTMQEVQQKVYEYLLTHTCVDCPESDPIVMEFDHKNKVTKWMAISSMMTQRYSWESILTEIEKCDVRCANCHSRKTAKEKKYYRYLLSQTKIPDQV